MKWITLAVSLFILTRILGSIPDNSVSAPKAAENRPVNHLVIVWLNESGSSEARERYIAASKKLSKLPGVVKYAIGPAYATADEERSASIDVSFDVAVSSTFENEAALRRYLQSEEHRQIVAQELRPLVKRFTVYNFTD